jgi:hypothetical protein
VDFSGCGPWVVEIACDAGVWSLWGAEGDAGGAAERLFEEERGGDVIRKGDSVVAELCFGVEEDGFVDKVLTDEGSVQPGAGFDEEAEDLAIREGFEDGGKAEVAVIGGQSEDLGSAGFEGGAVRGGSGGCAQDEEVVVGAADEFGGDWNTEVYVEDRAQEGPTSGEIGAVGEGWIVSEDGPDAGEDGVGGVAEGLDEGSGSGASEPVGLIGGAVCWWGRELAVDGERSFQGDEGAVMLDEVSEGLVEVAGLLLESGVGNLRDFDPGGAEFCDTLTADCWVGVNCSDDDPGDSSGDEGIRAWSGATVVAARFEGDIGGGSGYVHAAFGGLLECGDFGVVAGVVKVDARGDDLVLTGEDAAHLGVGRGEASGLAGEGEGLPHEGFVV